jgi:putative flippase GtrA
MRVLLARKDAFPAGPAPAAQRSGMLSRFVSDQRTAFLIVGGINTLVGLGCFAVAHHFWGHAIGYMGSLFVAYAVAILCAFVLHRRFVFRVQGHVLKDLARFTVVNLSVLGINAVLLPLLVEVFGVPVLPAQAVATLVSVCLSFFAHRSFSFRRTHAPSGEVLD